MSLAPHFAAGLGLHRTERTDTEGTVRQVVRQGKRQGNAAAWWGDLYQNSHTHKWPNNQQQHTCVCMQTSSTERPKSSESLRSGHSAVRSTDTYEVWGTAEH